MKHGESGRLMVNGKYVGAWAWSERKEEAFKTLHSAYVDALGVASAASLKHDELKKSNELTPSGIKAESQRWASRGGANGLVVAKARVDKIKQEIATRRNNLQMQGPDKHDVAGAILRQEIRAHLRGLDAAARTAMLTSDDVEADIALAVLEAPAALSGVTNDLRLSLVNRAVEALHPEEVEVIGKLEEAVEVTENAIRAANREIQSATGLADFEIEKMLANVQGEPPRLKRYGNEIKVICERPEGGFFARPATAEEIETGRFVDAD